MSGRRNVLLIIVDRWRADLVPALGADFLRTLNVDWLCRQGVTFRNDLPTAVPMLERKRGMTTLSMRISAAC